MLEVAVFVRGIRTNTGIQEEFRNCCCVMNTERVLFLVQRLQTSTFEVKDHWPTPSIYLNFQSSEFYSPVDTDWKYIILIAPRKAL